MNSRPALPDLSILELEQLKPHERVDDRRVKRLTELIEEQDVLKNPPVVLSPSASMDKYLILDGATRTAALRALGFEHVLAQVVDPVRENLRVEAWNHVVSRSTIEELLAKLEQDPMIQLRPAEETDRQSDGVGGIPALELLTNDRRSYRATPKVSGYESQMEFLNRFVHAYHQIGDVERTGTRQLANLSKLHKNFGYLVVLPRFELREVLDVTRRNQLFPAGITRFIIVPRALRVNYPLSRLKMDQPIEEKRDELSEWLREKTSQRGIRFYAESVFLYDD